ncbi:MAG: hypothetical protein ABL996_18690 [Micropepsaceae bacterium]
MITNKTWAIAGAGTALVLVGTAAALAADWGGGWLTEAKPKRTSTPAAYTRLMQFDADKDGRVTRTEVDAGLTAQFASADANVDGKLDPLEFQRFNDGRRAERKARLDAWRAKNDPDGKTRPPNDQNRDGLDPIKYTDWNLDGTVSPEEFASKTRAQAMRADRNGDGVIEREELKKGKGAKPK